MDDIKSVRKVCSAINIENSSVCIIFKQLTHYLGPKHPIVVDLYRI